jgi:hypothetical protein
MVEWPQLAYTGPMASAKKGRDLTDWIPGWMAEEDSGRKSACLHFFTKPSNGLKAGEPFEILTVATRGEDGLLALRGISISPLGSHGVTAPKIGDVVPGYSKESWVKSVFDGVHMENEIDSLHLQEFLSTAVIRKILTGHIIALHFAPILRQRQMNKSMKSGVKEKAGTSFAAQGESVTRATARIFKDLQAWGETRAAAVIAEAEDVTPTTIHNRLQLARAGKYLDTPGKGARR